MPIPELCTLQRIVQSNQISELDIRHVNAYAISSQLRCLDASQPKSCPSECARDTARTLGFATLKSEQEKAVAQFASGREVFVALPTCYRKSLCYY